ncbi:rhodanese-like domain-containing protein [Pyruvatibacter sp.]|uniref:rhodanese-like domain-containing protein n=1 Tax=Pyruvatibacter sp. TaxID=1981328 RepID=UPI0032ECEEAC
MSGYAGDIDVHEAWRILNEDARSVLIDVRTQAEWAFVGLPDISATGRPLITEEWQGFPGGAPNTSFADNVASQLAAAGVTAEVPVLCICRSGQRSAAAAQALTGLGFSACFNVAGGFEGPLDGDGHRGGVGGWKAAGLPWRQS